MGPTPAGPAERDRPATRRAAWQLERLVRWPLTATDSRMTANHTLDKTQTGTRASCNDTADSGSVRGSRRCRDTGVRSSDIGVFGGSNPHRGFLGNQQLGLLKIHRMGISS